MNQTVSASVFTFTTAKDRDIVFHQMSVEVNLVMNSMRILVPLRRHSRWSHKNASNTILKTSVLFQGQEDKVSNIFFAPSDAVMHNFPLP